jgi:transcriptional regulator with XRE-family HTH domain
VDTLGQKLRKLRKSKKWTLGEVAKKLGLKGHSTYSNWEYDRREPDLETIARIAELYDVDPNYLMPNQKNNVIGIRKNEVYHDYDKEKVDGIRSNFKDEDNTKEIYRIIKEGNVSDEELSKKIVFIYKDTTLSEEKNKQVIAFIRFLAESE